MSVEKILISQQQPSNMAPYNALHEQFGVDFEFKPFFITEPLTSLEFRAQRVNIAEYTAIVFSSRVAIDAFFSLCEELRVKIPETLKYFCTTELVAMYLQKHIVYRKRKIFYGTGTPESVVSLITAKHAGEKFLITTSDNSNTEPLTSLFDARKLDYTVAMFLKSVPQDLHGVNLSDYDLIMLYNCSDVKALYENYPDFEQGGIKFATYGKGIVKAMADKGLTISVKAPTPEAPSAAKAIELYLSAQK